MGLNSGFKGLKNKRIVAFDWNLYLVWTGERRSQWQRGLRRRSEATRLLRSWVRIPPGAWIFVCCECRVLSGRGLCDELNTRPEEYYRLWSVVMCDLETSRMWRPWLALDRSATENKWATDTKLKYAIRIAFHGTWLHDWASVIRT